MSKISDKKAKILKYITDSIKDIDPNNYNVDMYKKMFAKMSDKAFDEFMNNMKNGDWQLHITIPNLTKSYTVDDIKKTAEKINLPIFQRIWLTNNETGKKYLTGKKHIVLNLPIRRMQQYLDKKLSVPTSDRAIDGMTGQVTGADRSSSITNPEIQALNSKGLNKTLSELVTVRGGDISAYSEFKRQLEEQGSANLSDLSSNSKSRSAMIVNRLLEGMHLETNSARD